jgi:hypothetical protein
MKRLKGWKIRFKLNSSEGFCWWKQKVIDIGIRNDNPLRLMLHEIAHIQKNPLIGNQHNQKWFNEYLKLMNKYMPGTDISEHDKIIQKVYKLRNNL